MNALVWEREKNRKTDGKRERESFIFKMALVYIGIIYNLFLKYL